MYGDGLTAKRAVHIDRGCFDLDAEALGEDDLQDLSGPDILLARFDGRLKLGPFKIGEELRRLSRVAALPAKRQHGRRRFGMGGEPVEHVLDPAECLIVRLIGIALVNPGVGDDLEGALCMVEDEHRVAEDEVGLGEPKWIGVGVGKLFEMARHVIAEVSDGSPVKPGKSGDGCGTVLVEEVA